MKNTIFLFSVILSGMAICFQANAQQERKNQPGSENKQNNGAGNKDKVPQEIRYTTGTSGVRRSIGYIFNTAPADTNPGTGMFRYNKESIKEVSFILVNNIDISGEDQSDWYSTWDDTTGATGRGSINIVEHQGKNVNYFNVTGTFSKYNGYWKIPVEYISGTRPAEGTTYYYVFNRIAHKKPQSDKEQVAADIVQENIRVEVTPVTQETKPVEVAPVVQETRPAEVAPAVQETRPAEVAPAVQETRPAEVAPAVQETRPVEVTPVVQETRPAEVAPAVQETKPAEVAPVVQETRPAEVAPAVQETRPAEVAPVVQETRPAEVTPVVQETKPVEIAPVRQETRPAQETQPVRRQAPVPTQRPEPGGQRTTTAPVTQTTQPAQAVQVTQTTQPPKPSQTTTSNQTAPTTQAAQPVRSYSQQPAYQSGQTSVNQELQGGTARARRKWYSGIIEAGYGFGVTDYGISNFRINFINGFKIGRSSSIGLGIGYRRYFESTAHKNEWYLTSKKNQVPVFLDLRTSFSKRKITPYIALGLGGYADQDTTNAAQDGFYFCPSGGIWFNLSERFAIFAGIAYEQQKLEYILVADDSHFKRNAGSVSLNLGISF